MKHIVIIGNGISGTTAARHIRKRGNHRVTIISSEAEYFFSRTALMYIYMGHMRFENTKPYEDWFWKKNRIDLLFDHVEHLHPKEKTLTLKSGNKLSFDVLIIATGSVPNRLGWPGQHLRGVQGLYSFQDLQLMEENTRDVSRAVIVGGGLIGVEMAEMLLSRKINVTLLVREPYYWSNILPQEEAKLITNHIRHHDVTVVLNTELQSIEGRDRVHHIITTSGEKIACDFVGLTIGVSPNIEFLRDSGIELNRGVLVNSYLQTNYADIYAIGDCAERREPLPGRRSIEQVWYTGRMMGEVVAQTICDIPTPYDPGPWFNSAKFFEIEYQTYGQVGNTLRENEDDFYWEHSSGKKAMHFVWERTSEKFLGINTLGIRLRHECFDRWLRNNVTINFVMSHLAEANFDPEFFPRHEKEIVEAYRNRRVSARISTTTNIPHETA
jgi:NAD(P)H-nitrite reductase large subunit